LPAVVGCFAAGERRLSAPVGVCLVALVWLPGRGSCPHLKDCCFWEQGMTFEPDCFVDCFVLCSRMIWGLSLLTLVQLKALAQVQEGQERPYYFFFVLAPT
jgi:hypothetical protein